MPAIISRNTAQNGAARSVIGILGGSRSRTFALAVLIGASLAQGENTGNLPARETLHYGIEWRLITAGFARLSLQQNTAPQNQGGTTQLQLESTGLVAKLYKISDQYKASYEGGFCATDSFLNASEGKRHRETTVKFDRNSSKATYLEMDLIRKSIVSQIGRASCRERV